MPGALTVAPYPSVNTHLRRAAFLFLKFSTAAGVATVDTVASSAGFAVANSSPAGTHAITTPFGRRGFALAEKPNLATPDPAADGMVSAFDPNAGTATYVSYASDANTVADDLTATHQILFVIEGA